MAIKITNFFLAAERITNSFSQNYGEGGNLSKLTEKGKITQFNDQDLELAK